MDDLQQLLDLLSGGQVLAGEIDVQTQAVLSDQGVKQSLQQTAGVAQHHLINLEDQIALLGQRDEAARLMNFSLFIHQTGQQLDLHHAAIAQAQDRLEVGQDPIFLQGLLQRLFRGEAIRDVTQLGVEDGAVLSVALGLIGGDVDLTQQLADILDGGADGRHPQAGMDAEFVIVDHQGFLQLLQDAADDRGDRFGMLAGIQKDDELVATEAGDQIILSGRGAQALGHVLEQQITELIAVLFIDLMQG